MPKTKSLTVKQEKFVNGVIEGKSYRQAALEAGYSKNTAINASQDILAKPCVSKELTERVGQQGINADWVLANLKQDVEKTADVPNPVRTRSLELLGKATGAFGDRSNNGDTSVDNRGVPRVMREVAYGNVLETVKKWEGWFSNLQTFIKSLPSDRRKEAEKLFKEETMINLMGFDRLRLTNEIDHLALDVAKRMITAAGISWDSLFQKPSKNHT